MDLIKITIVRSRLEKRKKEKRDTDKIQIKYNFRMNDINKNCLK